MEYFRKEAKQVIMDLDSDPIKGLTSTEALERVRKYGKNEFSPGEKESIFKKIFDNLKEPLIVILIISAVISILMRKFYDGIGILVAVLIATTIAVIQEGRSDKAFEALSKQSENINVRVIRDGEVVYVPKSEITMGDILQLDIGDRIPADGRIIHSLQFRVDESMLTGESNPVAKEGNVIYKANVPLADRRNSVYSGTLVVDGRATVIVTGIGDNTEVGRIASELKESYHSETPLQQKLADLGKKISIIGSIAAAGIFLFELFNMFSAGKLNFEGVKEAFVVSVALIVAAVPEGLPTMVALTLAFNMQKMAKNNALVRKLIACETIGSVNVICSDKTGTLTQNRMTVVDAWQGGKAVSISELGMNSMVENFCINSTADLRATDNKLEFIGNPTECSLLVCAAKNNIDYKTLRDSTQMVAEHHFTSMRKMMSTVVKTADGYRVYAKGSPEKILAACSKAHLAEKAVKIEKDVLEKIEQEIEKLQKQAKRVIAFAYKDVFAESDWSNNALVEQDLIFDGFVGIEDPLREDVFDAITKCRRAGIAVKILTGDNINTAKAIASQLGILTENSLAMEVTEIENMSDEELSNIIDRLAVLARSNPTAKMRIVKILQERNNSVVVTGDGINDAPALKSADVGVAMGISGTEVSKEAAEIVLLDDSFSTIVKAVKWGRGIYENFQRFIQFQLTVNVVAFATAFIAEILRLGMPFTTLQLLWVNIIMDGPPALSLGLEPPREHLLNKKPIPRNASIVNRDMLFKIVTNGLFIVAALLFLIKTNILGGTSAAESKTIVFTAFVMFQLWNAFNCRELGNVSIFKHIHRNKSMLSIILLTFVIQIIVVQVGGEVFKTVGLEFGMWLKIIAYTFSVVVFGEIVKIIRLLFKRH